MPIIVHNTISGLPDEIVPGGARKDRVEDYPPVSIYSCGPTVYGYAHIGNFRTFMFNDFLRRYLRFRGYAVNHAMNITDVDDKTIAGAQKDGITLREYTEKYTNIFLEDLRALNIEPVEHMPRATESIDAMADIMERLRERGFVYEKDGSVYFSIAKYERYGRLSRLDTREIKSGLRYDTDEYEKDDVRDFALWKATAPNEPSWDTPFGPGRPGWHIECSAMVRKIFGGTIDIHTGGVDLIFPHHENEIAQSECAYGEPFVRHWIHVEHLLVEGKKMSKSLGNFYTLRDLLEKGHSPRSIRYLLISAHYRKQLNFTFDGLRQADAALDRIDNLIVRLGDAKGDGPVAAEVSGAIDSFLAKFAATVDDDLNISGGMGHFFDFLHEVNALIDRGTMTAAGRDAVITALRALDAVLGFIFFTAQADAGVDAARIESRIAERAAAKKAKDFARADLIRDELLAEGIILEDTKDGVRWKVKK
ncbi:MAG TPA: cysteine--tRNA ligase [Spirochaetota bacterium]|nr:cysteine--tRNA ligase [Spirochaetota bacterium]HNT13073.1 cysteine--tRNA ligase [Spirochaetota bacterium]